ncbi:MAG: AAA family ATPase [Chloroflexi bacterium]|nr:AAA family ATPase [Chloroflexota bacterium]
MKCPHCGFDSPPEMRYCGMCGTRLTVACSECGFSNPLNYRYCGMCGASLNAEIARPAAEPLPAPLETLGAPVPIQTAQPLEGERRVVTVIVTDLTESTRLLEKLGTEDWVELMNRILHVLESEVNRFGGEVSQFRGDGLVAMFGASLAHEDDPERAILAALSMQRAFDLYMREWHQNESVELKMRIGVNTGEVIVVNVSGRQHWEEAAMGMAVTGAARMEVSAEPGTVLVSEHTYELVAPLFTWQNLGRITVKGVSQPMAVYRPLTHVVGPNEIPQIQSFPNFIPRIGRELEFHTLKDCVKGLFAGRGRIAVVQGDQGSGKSFLTREVQQYFVHRGSLLAESHPVSPPETSKLSWGSGRCRSYSQTWPYSTWLDLFRDWLQFSPDDSREEKLACLRSHAGELWGSDLGEHYPYIATFLDLPLEEIFSEKIHHLDGESLRQRIFLAVRSWIEAASHKSPLVLVFSDLQWADDSSLALLRYCLPVCDNEPLLWVFTLRLERETVAWNFNQYLDAEYPHRLTSITLSPLTEAQSLELIGHLIGSEVLPTETSDLIIRNAGGNPYYILELVRVLISRGVLACNEDCTEWHMTRAMTTLDLPESLQQLLVARLDRLSAHERLVFQVAAVIGSVFWFNILEALLGNTPTLKADLAALQRAQFIEESGRVPELGMQYAIRSPLLRDTAYESLLSGQRAAYHLRVAEYLEGLSTTDALGGYDGMLAYHYRGAGKSRKELFYTLLAADHARKIYANTEALQHYSRAVELLACLEESSHSNEETHLLRTERFEVLNNRREVLYQLGQVVAAHADTRALLPLARQMGDDPTWLIDALLAEAEISHHNLESLSQGLQAAREALELSRKIGDRNREMRSLIRVADDLFLLRDHNWHDAAGQALSMARQMGDLKTEVQLLIGIGDAYGLDDLPRSREYLQEALSKSEKLNDKATEISLLSAIGQQFERDGDYFRQLTDYEMKRLHISRKIGNRMEEGSALMFCGQIQALYLGDYESGLETERQALHIWENINSRLFPLLRIAQIQAARGQCDEALVTLDSVRPLGQEIVWDIGRAGLGLVDVIVYNTLGDKEHLSMALEIVSQIQRMASSNLVSRQYQMAAACKAAASHLGLSRKFRGEKNAAVRSEHLRQALESSQAAVNLYDQFGFVQVVECTAEEILFGHGQALYANDRKPEALEFLKRAYEEMMRKHALIPPDSAYRNTFIGNIQLHREILAAYTLQKL